MPPTRQIYLLNPRALAPETIAVTFAKTSRSPESFREIAAELTDQKSAKFHEKWVVGYGHASVAEHAVLHLAIENISRLAVECLESNRLASYTEKSTRYQLWSPENYYVPRRLAESPHADRYRQTCARLFETYQRSLEPMRQVMQARYPREAGESEAKWEGRLRSNYVDNCRFLLPAASLANVGFTANARVLESAIRKMLSHPLEEVREMGAEIKRAAQAEIPTLVKYADPSPYQSGTAVTLAQAAARLLGTQPRPKVSHPVAELLDYDPEAETKFLAACLCRYSGYSTAECRAAVAGLSQAQKEELARDALGHLDQFDVPLRELEHITYTFDAVMDQGAYFEIKRHRLMTQSPQDLACDLGYAVPSAFEAANFRADYEAALQAAAETYAVLAADFPAEASYGVPNAFNRRLLMTLNLREAFHLCALRRAPNAHFSVRRLSGQIYAAIAGVHPLLASFMRGRHYPTWQEIEHEYFAAVV
jgi:thymidylate synthase ThyX